MKEKIKRAKYFLIAAGFAVLIYILFNWIVGAAVHSRKEVIVPDLSGKSLFEAVKLVSSLDLGLKVEGEEYNQDLPAGSVVRQSPYNGITVKEGKIIKVTVSQGGEVVFVPDLVGQNIRSARISLRSSGLNLGEESSKYSVAVEKGCVISHDPKAGVVAEKDALLNIVVSAGPPPNGVNLMPNFVNKKSDEAEKWAKTLTLNLVIEKEFSQTLEPGTVIKQFPEPDTELNSSSQVSVVVAQKNETAVVSGKMFVYELSQGKGDNKVRLTLIDNTGEREVFNGTRPSGSKIEVPISPNGSAKMRIFINNVLSEERDVQ